MYYTAINTKVCAMGAGLLGAGDYEQLCCMATAQEQEARLGQRTSFAQDLKRILPWLHDKALRDFVALMTHEPERGRDISDYLTLWKRLHRMDNANRKALLPVVGMEIDLRNTVWIYRLKRYYKVTGGETFGRLIPLRYRITETQARQMADAKNGKDLLAVFAESGYASIFQSFERAEQAINLALALQYKKMARLYPHSLAAVCGYLFAKKMETQNVRIAAEGVTQGLPPIEIQKRLITW
jgi:vacuolar-type H+-ATPase subunit C/Vma6